MKTLTKVGIASVVAAAGAFVTTYAVENALQREMHRQVREAVQRGELETYCGPLPISYATAGGFIALIMCPVGLVFRPCCVADLGRAPL